MTCYHLSILTTFVFLALFPLTFVFAAPRLHSAHAHLLKRSTHRSHTLPRGLKLYSYHPVSLFEVCRIVSPFFSHSNLPQTYYDGLDHPLSKRANTSLQESAAAFVQHRLNLRPHDVRVHSSFKGASARHAYIKQQINGIPVANAVANIALNNEGKVVAFGSSFLHNGGFHFVLEHSHRIDVVELSIAKAPSPIPSISVASAITTAEHHLDGRYDQTHYPAPSLQYLAKEDGSFALTHVFHVTNDTNGTYYEAFVDAHSGELVSVTDFVAQATVRHASKFLSNSRLTIYLVQSASSRERGIDRRI